jgi:hypothetical protein
VSDPHHYVWTGFALRAQGLAAGSDPDAVIKAVGDGALASGAITTRLLFGKR